MSGCLMCGSEVEHYEFTLLCDKCEDKNLRYANEENDGENRGRK